MINITFPDQQVKTFEKGVSALDVATSISKSLAKSTIAVAVNGNLQDAYLPLEEDCNLQLITKKDQEAIEIIRHDGAHILAQAVKELYPEVQVTIGPVIENGFYYDFATKEPFTLEDLPKIEQRMKQIVARGDEIRREVWSRDQAIKFFSDLGEEYKVKIIEDLPEDLEISFYRQGDFVDLCRGPHAPKTTYVQHFKLTKLSGAYWRGDAKNEMLQRIYGVAFASKDELDAYLHMVEEAKLRDHRKIGQEMDLFHLQEEGVGQVFWHAQGWTLYRIIENYIRKKLQENDYQEIKTPLLLDRKLWEKSGHWDKFRENMFISGDDDDKVLAIKPMNCPCHVQVFNHDLRSYRDLPLRMAEFGMCHRNEPSGSLHGIMRVRGFVQDDAHIFCEESQITSETVAFCKLLLDVYRDFGFTDVAVKFSDRPEKRAGDDEVWDRAEQSLKDAVEQTGLTYELNSGEGAFYGPKLEFVLRDAIGRDWQCGTLQLDFVLPERLDANYIGQDGAKHRPVMIHRAILGTFERFIGILIEQYAGKFPLWLAPTQVVVTTITNKVDDYALEVFEALKKANIRAEIDLSSEKISYKVRQHSLKKVPYIFTVGEREKENKEVSLRKLGEKHQKCLSLNDSIESLTKQIYNLT